MRNKSCGVAGWVARWLRAGVAAVVLAASACGAAHANLVSDGTFQDTLFSTSNTVGGYLCQDNNSSNCVSNLVKWSGTCAQGGCTGSSSPSSILLAGSNGAAWNGGFGLYGSNVTNPPGGGNVVALDGASQFAATLSQTINGLTVGDEYLLQFYQSASQQIGSSGATTEQFQVTLGSSTQLSPLQSTPSRTQEPWAQVSLGFVADASSEVLSFLALGTPSIEPPVALLADVSLTQQAGTPAPEPASLALAASGLLALRLARRRRAG